ncbi:uncharacterized protein KNAG_0C06390 [Huiozyma naganishii CBS 8797]|uniref:Uncharacterized protein n=1 Tax=Huiozyma naganishii (strain ATCC MYA-139 / BCRC 22969 / CBS 8797 / KCTC 17520 / NBRC 10181 / NCYC 3082 / Yp74L-3) TaxID=1071383 RepID=J7RXC9_HUIN7|nr:hypothetical protein KNAG_0C06390 [Kazachstania naganishii CBS 8797]CCK69732.1 hypothetical protein KNAG_0C06390 [Kazachstania naganishii CBS 8797]
MSRISYSIASLHEKLDVLSCLYGKATPETDEDVRLYSLEYMNELLTQDIAKYQLRVQTERLELAKLKGDISLLRKLLDETSIPEDEQCVNAREKLQSCKTDLLRRCRERLSHALPENTEPIYITCLEELRHIPTDDVAKVMQFITSNYDILSELPKDKENTAVDTIVSNCRQLEITPINDRRCSLYKTPKSSIKKSIRLNPINTTAGEPKFVFEEKTVAVLTPLTKLLSPVNLGHKRMVDGDPTRVGAVWDVHELPSYKRRRTLVCNNPIK